MEIYMSQDNSAAEFVWFLHECKGGVDFSFEGKQRWGLMKWERDSVFLCEMRNWRNRLVGCRALRRMLQVLACPGAWASTKQRQQSVFTLHHQCSHTASEDHLFCGKRESSSLDSSCSGRTIPNATIIQQRMHRPMETWLENVGMVRLQVVINSYQVVIIFTHYQDCFGNRELKSRLSHCHSLTLFGSNSILLSHWFPLILSTIIPECFKCCHFLEWPKSYALGFFQLDSLWMCYLTAYTCFYSWWL